MIDKFNDLINMINDKYISKLNKYVNKKTVLGLLIIITIVILIPVLWISFYAHPSVDDFSYGIYTMNKFQSDGILGVLSGVPKILSLYYLKWQGTFSAIVLFALSPTVWSDNLYFLTTFIILLSLFFSLQYLFRQILHKGLKIDKVSLWIVILSIFILLVETIPDKTQGLYWWNGASYYIIFFSLELIEIGLLVKRYFLEKKTKLNYALLCLLIFLIGGGNFVTALQQIIILSFLNIYLIIAKKDKSALPLLGISIVSFAISAVAPGNAYRANSLQGMNPVKAIILSFYHALNKIFTWTNSFVLMTIPLLLALLYPTYKKLKFKFNYPLLVLLVVYGVFAAEFTPTLYSSSNIGEGRLWNIMYISYVLLLFGYLYYLVGYIRLKLIENKIFNSKAHDKLSKLLINNSLIIGLSILLILMATFYFNLEDKTTYITYRSLKYKEAQTYDKEYKERLKVLKNEKIKNVEFKEFSIYAYPIFVCEIDENPKNWRNKPLAQIYGKNYVKLVKSKTQDKE